MIPEATFSDCVYLKTLKLPSTLRTVGAYAFNGSGALKRLTLPEGVESLGEGAFMTCGLKTISLPASLASIGENAFDAQDEGVTVTAPEDSAAWAHMEAQYPGFKLRKPTQ